MKTISVVLLGVTLAQVQQFYPNAYSDPILTDHIIIDDVNGLNVDAILSVLPNAILKGSNSSESV